MSTDGLDTAGGLADTRDQGPQAEVSPPSDPLAETEAGFGELPSSDAPLRDVAERAAGGGMGTVYACFDDKLDRRLVLKLLKGPESEAARKRMLREAQAMVDGCSGDRIGEVEF